MNKSIIAALIMGFSFAANASTAESFTQHTMDEVQAQIAAKNKAEVCVIDMPGEAGPEQLSIGVNKVSNTVVVLGYMKEGDSAIMPMFSAMSKDKAVEFSKQIKIVANSDVNELVDDEFFYHKHKSNNGVELAIEKYSGGEIYLSVSDENSMIGGYGTDIKDMTDMVSGCVESASNYL